MDSELVLDFPVIRERLASHCSSTIAKEMALELTPMVDVKAIQSALDEVEEAMRSWQTEVEQPLAGTRDIRLVCTKSRKEVILTKEELWDVCVTIDAYRRMVSFFKEKYMLYPLLSLWIQDIQLPERLAQRLRRVFDDKGDLVDGASPRLQMIRSTIVRTRDRIKQDLQSILHDKDNQKYFQEAIVTQRNQRYVIPVKQEYRYAFPGLIHDKSATGATLYIEPMRLVELNNELQEALIEEEQEIMRIYKELSQMVRKESPALMDACEKVSHVEFVYGKAKYAIQIKAMPAKISPERTVDLIEARHPLIPANQVVPTTIRLGKDYRILLITGSNTGGKTVAMKTLGLLCLMNQAGMCIPADTGSTLPVFQHIYADIGDEQSIEASLSTFSSHMTQVIRMLKQAGGHDLVLLDELGSGTDPEEGSALAVAILDAFRKKQCLMMVSTHYNELKNYAYRTDGIENGHVEFDERTLRPTYRLHIGVAGSSHALSIASRLGLPRDVIQQARQYKEKMGHSDMDNVLSELNQQLRLQSERERAIKKEHNEIRRMRGQLEKEKQEFHEKRKQILTKAREEAQTLKQTLRVEGEQIIKTLKQNFSEKNQGKRQAAIDEARRSIQGIHIPAFEGNERPKVEPSALQAGMVVYVLSLQAAGTVLSVQGKRVAVDVNGLTATVKLSDLGQASPEEQRRLRKEDKAPKRAERRKAGAAVKRQQEASTELNIIGQTVDEAVVSVSRFIDQALLAGLSQVRIIHGKGTGALREGVWNYLRTLPHVERFEMAGYTEGGAGATNVYLR